ncbi:MAG: EamA family transporter [Polyangiaceae bacterium]|nr:EamA family transporter [Polyangiaceae bacterium]
MIEPPPSARAVLPRGAALMVVAAVGFAVMNACAKEASLRLPFIEIAFARSLVGAVALALYARARGASLAIHNRRLMALRAGSGVAAMALTFYALSVSPLGEASALLNLTPLFVALLGAVFLGERPSPAIVVALCLGMAGALLVFQPRPGALSRGGVAAICASATAAVSMVSLRRLGDTESSEAVVTHFLAAGAVVTLVATAPVFVTPTARELSLLVVAGLSATVAQVTMTRAYAADVAARVGGMNYLQIVAGLALGAAVFGERPGALAWAGIAAILAAGAALVWSARRAPAQDGTSL